jgi:PPOX class probable F420-dependent enzyme
MTAGVLPDADTAFGRRVRTRRNDERVVWLTTVGADGTPQPNPVWFLWREPDRVLIYNRADAHRLAHLAARPRVALHFDGNGQGGDIVVLAGEARVAPEDGPADAHAAFVAKYAEKIARSFGAPAHFAARYSTPLRVTPTRVRGH